MLKQEKTQAPSLKEEDSLDKRRRYLYSCSSTHEPFHYEYLLADLSLQHTTRKTSGLDANQKFSSFMNFTLFISLTIPPISGPTVWQDSFVSMCERDGMVFQWVCLSLGRQILRAMAPHPHSSSPSPGLATACFPSEVTQRLWGTAC